MDSKRLFLLDAYALIFRAYYALIRMPRISSKGFNTSAIFGFVNTLEEILRKEAPTHMAVCFDPPGPTFRHEADAKYKAERAQTPEDIKLSIPYIKRIIEAYRIPVVEIPGFEADDVIGTLATRAATKGYTTYMMTPDKDFGQLVGPSVLQYKPSYRGQDFELRGEREVCERYGIQRTGQVIDLLALMGDKIDNIPGCPGVGEKTAVKLIADFDNVENLLEHTSELKGALRKKVEENAGQIRFSKFLATIRTDVPIDIDADTLRVEEPDRNALFEVFRELEFKTLETRVARRLDAASIEKQAGPKGPVQPSLFDAVDEAPAAPQVTDAERVEVKTVATTEDADTLARHLADAAQGAFAAVTEGDSDMDCRLLGVGVALPSGENWYVPAAQKEGMAQVLDAWARPDLEKITADAKRDYVVARRLRGDNEVPLTNYYDVSLAHYLLQPETRHTLPALAETLLHRRVELNADALDAAACARALLDMTPGLRADIEKEELMPLLRNIELPLAAVLAEMELAGVRIDVEALDKAADGMRRRIAALETEIYTLAGMEFNIGSPSKVGEVLFDVLHLDDKAKKTKSGKYSTSEEVLAKLVPKHPVVGKILMHRSLRKLLNTYLTTLPTAINPATGRVHTTYNQTVTATGRLSSSNPNLQNIPVRDEEGRDIRRAFIPSEGNLFLSADYSQIELRLVADFAGEETMIEAFRHDRDIHAITAAKIYHEDLEKVTADQRRHAKTANFGILYGISAFGLSQRLGIPRAEAKELIDGYFETFPKVRLYMSQAVEHAREEGIVRTRMGRRRMLPDINSRNPTVRGYAERNAINAPIQGTAADIIKKAMVDIAAELRRRGLKTKMIMQVHDELNFEVPPGEVAEVQELVARMMQQAFDGAVPLTASVGVADNWLDAH